MEAEDISSDQVLITALAETQYLYLSLSDDGFQFDMLLEARIIKRGERELLLKLSGPLSVNTHYFFQFVWSPPSQKLRGCPTPGEKFSLTKSSTRALLF